MGFEARPCILSFASFLFWTSAFLAILFLAFSCGMFWKRADLRTDLGVLHANLSKILNPQGYNVVPARGKIKYSLWRSKGRFEATRVPANCTGATSLSTLSCITVGCVYNGSTTVNSSVPVLRAWWDCPIEDWSQWIGCADKAKEKYEPARGLPIVAIMMVALAAIFVALYSCMGVFRPTRSRSMWALMACLGIFFCILAAIIATIGFALAIDFVNDPCGNSNNDSSTAEAYWFGLAAVVLCWWLIAAALVLAVMSFPRVKTVAGAAVAKA